MTLEKAKGPNGGEMLHANLLSSNALYPAITLASWFIKPPLKDVIVVWASLQRQKPKANSLSFVQTKNGLFRVSTGNSAIVALYTLR